MAYTQASAGLEGPVVAKWGGTTHSADLEQPMAANWVTHRKPVPLHTDKGENEAGRPMAYTQASAGLEGPVVAKWGGTTHSADLEQPMAAKWVTHRKPVPLHTDKGKNEAGRPMAYTQASAGLEGRPVVAKWGGTTHSA